MGGPWREVVWIELCGPGPRGGYWWVLTLSCGHHKAVTKPRFRPEQLVYFSADEILRRACAPHRVRCLHCELAEADQPTD